MDAQTDAFSCVEPLSVKFRSLKSLTTFYFVRFNFSKHPPASTSLKKRNGAALLRHII